MNYRNFARIYWIDRQIQRGRLENCQQIADEFEISLRSAERLLKKMREELGAEIRYNKKEKRYEYVGEPITLPNQWLNKEEIALILIAERALRSVSKSGLNEFIHPAFNKFLNPIREHVDEMQYVRDMCNAVHFYQPIVPQNNQPETYSRLLNAILQQKEVTFHYRKNLSDHGKKRQLSPYLLLHNEREWQLVGKEKVSRKIKTFALNRMSEVTIIDFFFAFPPDFNPQDYYAHPFESLRKSLTKQVIVLAIPRKYEQDIHEFLWHPSQKIIEERERDILVEFQCHRTTFFNRWMRAMEAREVE